MPRLVKDMLGSWRGQKGNRTWLPIWRMAPLCLMWCVWRERNARCFEDCETGLMNLKRMMLQTLFMWREKFQFMHECSYFEFIDKCSLFFIELGASYIRLVYYGLRPFAPFQYTLLIKKTCNATVEFQLIVIE
jgi:hypothetical protein